MSSYGKIARRTWNSRTFRSLSEDARTLWLYLLTSPHANTLGLYVLRPAYAVDDLQWMGERDRAIPVPIPVSIHTAKDPQPDDVKNVEKALRDAPTRYRNAMTELLLVETSDGTIGLVKYDPAHHLVLIRNFYEFNQFVNSKHVQGAIAKLNDLPDSPLFRDLADALQAAIDDDGNTKKDLYKPLKQAAEARAKAHQKKRKETRTDTSMDTSIQTSIDTSHETSTDTSIDTRTDTKEKEKEKDTSTDKRVHTEEAAPPEPSAASGAPSWMPGDLRKKKRQDAEPSMVTFSVPTQEEIEHAALPRIEELTRGMCKLLKDSKKFPRAFAFVAKQMLDGSDPRAVLYTMVRLHQQQIEGNPWAYATSILQVEEGNFREREHARQKGFSHEPADEGR